MLFREVAPRLLRAFARRLSTRELRPFEIPPSLGLSAAAVPSPAHSRMLRCCLIGPTNAGKSTLINALINQHVSIVSPRMHTTRENTLGFLTDETMRTQVEFIDAVPKSLSGKILRKDLRLMK